MSDPSERSLAGAPPAPEPTSAAASPPSREPAALEAPPVPREPLWRRLFEKARGPLLFLTAIAAIVPFVRYGTKAYAVQDWLAWPLLEVWGYVALFWLGAASFGLLALKRLLRHEADSSFEALALALPLGVLGFNTAMYLGGALALFRPWFAIALPTVMLASGSRQLYALARNWRSRDDGKPQTPVGKVLTGAATALGVMGIFLLYLQAMTPEAINFDASWSHLVIAQDYAREGRMVAFDGDYTKCFPHLASVVHTYAFLVPLPKEPQRWMLALHNELGAVLATLLGVGALIESLVGRRVRAGWVVFFLFPGIFVYDLNIGGGADHYEALFTAPLVLAGLRALRTSSIRWYVLTGLFAGAALATKLHAIHVVAPLTLLLAIGMLRSGISELRASRKLRPTAKVGFGPAVGFGGALFLALSPHLLRNAVFHGNPVYPFALDLFHRSHPVAPRASFLFEYLFKDWTWRPHGTTYENLREAGKLFFSFSFNPHYSFTKEVPNFGSLFTLTLPWLFFVRGRKPIGQATLIAFGAMFMWAMTFRVDRHLQPFVPLLAATTGALIARAWEIGTFSRMGVATLLGAQLLYSGDVISYSGTQRIDASLELIRSGYDGRAKTRFDSYRKVFRDIGAALPKDALVVQHTYRPSLGINRRMYRDWVGQQGLISYEPLHNPREVFDLYRHLGVTHFLVLPERPAPTKQEDAIFTTFVRRYGKGLRHFGGYDLIEMPKTAPPEDHPWRALSLGVSGYADGIYPIESMNTPDALPEPFRKYPAPVEPIAPASEAIEGALTSVDVVFVGPNRMGEVTTHKLDARFEHIATFGRTHAIYVKK